jgi:hypothetical protein
MADRKLEPGCPPFSADGHEYRGSGEVHFAWVLEGRAMEDVWIMENTHGMTLPVWSPSIEAWRVVWINPVTGARDELVERRCDQEIVQVGTHANGKTWRLEAEFRARRATK